MYLEALAFHLHRGCAMFELACVSKGAKLAVPMQLEIACVSRLVYVFD